MADESFARIALHRSTISVSKPLINEIGLKESIILTELMSKYFYWKDVNRLTRDGYFFCTVDDLLCSTCIPKQSQINCIKKLSSMNLIETEKRGMPSKRYFTFTDENIDNFKKYTQLGQEKMSGFYNKRNKSETATNDPVIPY